ncbi:hypothetical protein [Desulfofundulus thermosubterraneus]|uniref:hypothetical protein n=1 Tax=Desulfofundulus thermosubterraneus TaxID=348840 RepID=UPI0010424C56|nr:hypothetical protein [Desulfofundulus thermosubterraneus]
MLSKETCAIPEAELVFLGVAGFGSAENGGTQKMIGINGQEEQIAWSGVPPLRPIFARHESRAVCARRFPNEQNFKRGEDFIYRLNL